MYSQFISVSWVFIYAELLCRAFRHDLILLIVLFFKVIFVSQENGILLFTFVSTGMFSHISCPCSSTLRIIPSFKRHSVGSHLLEFPVINVWTENTIPSETGGKWIELSTLFYLRHDLQLSFSYFVVIFHFCCHLISAGRFRFPSAVSFPYT